MGGRHATASRIRDANAPMAATDSDERRQVRAPQRRPSTGLRRVLARRACDEYARPRAQAIASSHACSNAVDQGQRPISGIA